MSGDRLSDAEETEAQRLYAKLCEGIAEGDGWGVTPELAIKVLRSEYAKLKAERDALLRWEISGNPKDGYHIKGLWSKNAPFPTFEKAADVLLKYVASLKPRRTPE